MLLRCERLEPPILDGLNCELPSCVGLVRSSLNFRRDVAPSRASKWATSRRTAPQQKSVQKGRVALFSVISGKRDLYRRG